MLLLIYTTDKQDQIAKTQEEKLSQKIVLLEKKLTNRDKIIDDRAKMIFKYREMITYDDFLLNGFMHGTWDRSCEYEHIAGRLLADGSVKESLIQHCEDTNEPIK